jgi:hypothetical protein
MRTDSFDGSEGEYRFMAALWKPAGESDESEAPKHVAAVRREFRMLSGDDQLRIELRIP